MGFGSSLKKIAKDTVSTGKGVLGFGSSKGPSNPYSPVDWSQLLDTSKIDYLRNPVAGKPNTAALFDDYLGAINAPSGADEVSKRIEGELMQSLLGGVDDDVSGAVGGLKSDFFDRGLSGPGMISDIEAGELGRTRALGARAKGDIRSQFGLRELEREKAKEVARTSAYGARYAGGEDLYKTLLGFDQENQGQFADLVNQLKIAAATGQSGAYNSGADRKLAGTKPSVFEDIMRNIKVGFNFGS